MSTASSKPNQHQIFQGDIFYGIISHIINHEVFYVVKTESTVVLAELQEHIANNEPSKMFWYPSINEKFLINLEDEYFRAKRVALSEDDKKDTEFMQTFLIDTGETFLIPTNGQDSMNANDFSMVPEEFMDIPPLAKKCKWIEEEKDEAEKLEFLKSNILKNIQTFEAIKVRGETITVKIYPFEKEDNKEVVENIKEEQKIEETDNRGTNMFTADEMEELYEEPLATSDALVAVQGYSTNDDANLCKFYDPNTGGCFKGAKCKLKHLPLATDSYECRDREEVFYEKKDFGLILPNQYYDIKIMFIMSPKRFIFRFIDPDYQAKLEDIQEQINNKSEIRNYKKMAFIPEIEQLVLFKDGDIFKRAKVMDDINDNYVVWCLDEGCLKGASMNALYDWNIRLNEPKFLTDQMEISNIISIRDNDVRAKFRLLDFQRIDTLKALTVQTVPTLTCRLFDKDNNDIGEILINEGFAIKNEIELCTDFNSNQILPI